MTASVLLSIPLAASSGCGPRITDANVAVVNRQRIALERVGKGISPKEVESILGQPAKVETTKLPLETQKKEVDVVRYFYTQDGQTMVLHFVDNKLVSEATPFGQAQPGPVEK
jgi:hypothetical protein